MQIHELNKRNVLEQRPPKPAPVTGLDTSKVSPYIAAQIKKAEADSQANLTQQAQAPIQPAPPPSYGKNTAMPTTPLTVPGAGTNAAPGQPTAQPASDSVVGKKPSLADRAKGLVNSRQAGINQRYDSGQYEKSVKDKHWLGLQSKQAQIQQQYNKLKPMATPGFDTKSDKINTTAATPGRGSNTIPPKVLQQAAKGTYITKTGDYETDKMLQTLGYRFK